MAKQRKPDPWRVAVYLGWRDAAQHPLFRTLRIGLTDDEDLPNGVWADIQPDAVRFNPRIRAESDLWAWVFAHLFLHAGFGHLDPRTAEPGDLDRPVGRNRRRAPKVHYQAACCVAVDRFLTSVGIGRPPRPLPDLPAEDEATLARRWSAGVPAEYAPGDHPDFTVGTEREADWHKYPAELAIGVSSAATAAVTVASGGDPIRRKPPWELALGWFVSSYPLLGALAAGLKIVADADVARGWQIAIAAVNAEAGEIYINPLRDLPAEEWRFVLAHEMLHAALRHGDRVGGRDPYLWNVACDFVVNGWLVEMNVGEMPEGLLYDPDLRGLSSEEVYDRVSTDLRRMRRLATLRGKGLGDLLNEPATPGRYADLDAYYRSALANGLEYHLSAGRGDLPSGLEQEIRALDQPPLPWDAQLARWFDEHVPSPTRKRTYARASRRQSSSPDIPRPGWILPEEVVRHATFGVVLDTSGSMDVRLLGKALGAIASYALARDVPQARVVFCDAAAYDAGYLPVETIAGKVRVRGRGGTVLQPGVNLLERADDFPQGGPILIITDGWCDVVRVRREHAYLVPEGASLPFRPRGPVFRMR
ncbi:hypothetical protein FDA94_14565 [Herbidospora galbida]|uniref:Putative metallopeptidase domain-containing protein n=1 Tax=Herbidospora galbida TaxID=2575442 RepID=A0A4V5UZC9_9ACTN|nr:hypothetical protein [Herbidospora galbida]TKK88243.1 hypothetical protein FDA94_14565 [Herbidospora galbida]